MDLAIYDIKEMFIPPEVLCRIDAEFASKYQVLPLAVESAASGPRLVVGFSNADLLRQIPLLQETVKGSVRLVNYDATMLSEAIERHYGSMGQSAPIIKQIEIVGRDMDADAATPISEAESSVVSELVNAILMTALEARASDIHIKPTKQTTVVLFREDGEIYDYTSKFNISRNEHANVIRRVQMICRPQMDIGKSQVPLDGSFQFVAGDRSIDCRVATLPTVNGLKLNIRLFDLNEKLRDLGDLGYPAADVARLKKLLHRPSGMMLVSAPTGQGKSTTIHAAMGLFNPLKSIQILIEDPVEERLPNVDQVQIREVREEELSLTPEKALRACMRQDPDILGVGEIRDPQTAKTAVMMSQTGHLMFSTVHARDSISALARVFELGVPRGDFLREMVCLISQRLVRTICPDCAEKAEVPAELLEYLTPDEVKLMSEGTLKKGKGCRCCNHRGYRGRIAVPEYIVFDNEVRDYLAESRGIQETIAFLREKKGYVPMWEKGLALVAEGRTTIEEVIARIAPDR